jgi:tRNA (guanine37-N1)-methyltransferase
MKIDVITIFPEILDGALRHSMMGKALDRGLLELSCVDPRTFATDTHRTVDDRPFGGGPGMLMMCEPLFAAVRSVKEKHSHVIFMTPQGTPFNHAHSIELSRKEHMIFICGHYEGIDERIREALVDEEISIGDYVLTNGVLPAAVVIDAVTRQLPGMLGAEEGAALDSFADGLLEHPQYTRPADFEGMKVPEVLLSGNHKAIGQWRKEQSIARTQARRPDLPLTDCDS